MSGTTPVWANELEIHDVIDVPDLGKRTVIGVQVGREVKVIFREEILPRTFHPTKVLDLIGREDEGVEIDEKQRLRRL